MRKHPHSAARRRATVAEPSNGVLTGLCALTVIICALLWAGTAMAEETLEDVFARFDKNGDGTIDRTEFDLNKVLVIVAFDKNRNDHLDADEIMMSAENFTAMDQDGDGKISGFEFVESDLGKFEAIDADGDGLVTKEEFRAYVEKLRN